MEPNAFVDVPICPVCDSSTGRIVYAPLYLAPEFGGGDKVQLAVLKCAHCGTAYLSRRLSNEQLSYFYNGSPDLDTWYREVFPATIPKIVRWMHLYGQEFQAMLPRVRVLDFGCGSGVFTAELRRRAFEVVPFDSGAAAKRLAQTHFGVDVRTNLSEIGDQFDAVAMLDVIEHIANPIPLLKLLREKIKVGGILHVTTPNFSSIARIVRGVTWKALDCRGHLIYFDPQSARFALRRAGFEIIRVRTWGPLSFLLPFPGGHALSIFARRS